MLDGSKEVICKVLKTLAEPMNGPCAFHCASGKDRTGLIAMLLMASTGCTRREIVEDYHESEDLASQQRTIDSLVSAIQQTNIWTRVL